MADYKRMISYIYNYENGSKRNNVGYARIEIRGNQCKVTIHVKAMSIIDPLKACLFYRDKETIFCVSLGEIFIKNGIGEFQVTTTKNRIMDTAYSFDDMSGIILYASSEKFFGSEWDDRAITAKEIRFTEKDKKNQEAPTLEASKEEFKAEERPIEGRTKVEEPVKGNNEEEKKIKGNPEGEKPVEEKPEAERRAEEEREEIREDEFLQEADERIDKPLEAAEYRNKMPDYKSSRIGMETRREERNNKTRSPGNPMPFENPPSYESPTPLQDMEEGDANLASFLLHEYPKMYPFEDDDILDCVRLEPQDIGLFPMELWTLANNSFLLHGYYSYRHLIFAKVRSGNKIVYILGVPGIYHNREEFMAKMFGFYTFKTIKRKDSKMGEFGYWCINVKI